jgi:hypothetical protein
MIGLALLLASGLAWADPSPRPSPTVKSTKAAAKKTKGRGKREKETEGTEAPDRFEADTVIKSRYELNGQPLEVDPD